MTEKQESLKKDHLLSNTAYDVTKFIAQILLPALGTLYFALESIWGLPDAQKVVGTITAVDAFLGALLSLSTKSYNASDARFDGDIEIEDKPEGPKVFSLSLDGDPNELDKKKQVTFKIKSV